VLTLAAAACGSSGGDSAAASPQWTQVFTARVSGAQPVKLNLGVHELGNGARLGWRLTGPETAPPVMLTFRIISVENGVGYGNSISPKDPSFSLDDTEAVVLAPIRPGKYSVYFSQRFPSGKGPGYDGTLTISPFNDAK
jgi:hypothetical protein